MKTYSNLSAQRRAEIIALATEVFSEHFAEPPADPLRILAEHGITYSFGHYGDSFDGLLEYESDSFHVYCNLDRENREGSPRGRFTLSHELAHYFIDQHREALISGRVKPHPSNESDSSNDLLPEREADLFASFFLMPESLLAKSARRLPAGYESIKKLADMFQVSFRCAAIRYVECGLYPAAIIFWNTQGYKWKRISNALWLMGCRKSIEDVNSILEDSATSQMLSSKKPGLLVCESHSVLGSWFPTIQRPSIREIIVREQAISLGRFGTLTLVEPLDWKHTPQEIKFSTLADSLVNWSSS